MNINEARHFAKSSNIEPNSFDVTILLGLSASMAVLIHNNTIQKLLNTLVLPVNVLSKSRDARFVPFSVDANECPVRFNAKTALNYLEKNVVGKYIFGSLSYASGIKKFQDIVEQKKDLEFNRNLAILIVNRDCNDSVRTQSVMNNLSYSNSFIYAISIGPSNRFNFLERMNDTMRSNLRHQWIKDLNVLESMQLTKQMIDSIKSWLKTTGSNHDATSS